MRRANETVAQWRERQRAAIEVETHIACVVECAKRLQEGLEPTTHPITREREMVPLDGPRVAALGKAADVHLRLISLVLPSPKAIELSGSGGAPLDMASPDRLVLRTKLLALIREEQEQGTNDMNEAIEIEDDVLPEFLR